MIKVLFICHGNICRSPISEYVLKDMVEKRGLTDYLLCADSNNIRNTLRITGPDKEGKVKLLLDFTDRPGRSIADPWYTGDFEETYRDVYEGCTALLEALEK